MSTPAEKAAAAVVDLVERVGIEEAAARLNQLATEREASLSTPTDGEARPCECDEPDGYCEVCEDAHGHTCIICGCDFCGLHWEDAGHNDTCKRVVMADGSIAAACTDGEARELAGRWAFWQGVVIRQDPHGLFPPLCRDDHARLFAWVRERMLAHGRCADPEGAREDWAGDIADALDLWDADDECPRTHALCEAATGGLWREKGWPS